MDLAPLAFLALGLLMFLAGAAFYLLGHGVSIVVVVIGAGFLLAAAATAVVPER